MTTTVRVDSQGRVVIPLVERERLGLAQGGSLELVSTPEGLLLEPRHRATVSVADDGLPVVTLDGGETVDNTATVDAIRDQRAGR